MRVAVDAQLQRRDDAVKRADQALLVVVLDAVAARVEPDDRK